MIDASERFFDKRSNFQCSIFKLKVKLISLYSPGLSDQSDQSIDQYLIDVSISKHFASITSSILELNSKMESLSEKQLLQQMHNQKAMEDASNKIDELLTFVEPLKNNQHMIMKKIYFFTIILVLFGFGTLAICGFMFYKNFL